MVAVMTGKKIRNIPKPEIDHRPWMRPISKCECGFGEGFYCSGKGGIHEYNPFVDEKKATALEQKDRRPTAVIFGHIDGRRVVLQAGGKERSFTYREYGGKDQAFIAAIKTLKPGLDQKHKQQIELL